MNLELIDIFNDIKPDSEFYFNETETLDFIENVLILMTEFMETNPTIISDPDFTDIFEENILELVMCQFENDEWFDLNSDENEEDIELLLDYCTEIFFQTYTKREQPICEIPIINSIDSTNIKNRIEYLSNISQPAQRTPEWYDFRRNLITASNAYKIFESECQRNSLICEKCIETPIEPLSQFVNINSPLHWGQKYEPISQMLYETLFNTTIKEFGCIRHQYYSFLGASPDGICIDELSPYYGYMLEIKNPISRDITGVAKKEYWIQCQLQMEVCDLNNCHFLETKFKEFKNEEEYNNSTNKWKGFMLYFSKDGKPYYYYKPLHLNDNEIEDWINTQIENNCDKTFIKYIYWYLDNYSCILIKRNYDWFKNNIQTITDFWNIILDERKTGYKHRLPKKNGFNNSNLKVFQGDFDEDSGENQTILEKKCFLIKNKNKTKIVQLSPTNIIKIEF